MPGKSDREMAKLAAALSKADPERVLPSLWASRKRNIPDLRTRAIRKFSWRDFPFLIQICNDWSPDLTVMKAAQVGVTEGIIITRALHFVTVVGVDTMLLLPSADECGDFSRGRIDPAISSSPELADVFSDVENVHHKRCGITNLYLRGTRSRTKLRSVPAGALLMDEFDVMDHENIGLAYRRTSGQVDSWVIRTSTPSYPNYGIDKEWKRSDKHHWHVRCPFCNEMDWMTWKGNVRWEGEDPEEASRNATWCCSKCSEPWTNDQRLEIIRDGIWIPESPGAPTRGYHVSQLYSPVSTAARLVHEYLVSRGQPERWRIFVTEVLGIAMAELGSQLTRAQVRACREGYLLPDAGSMGAFVTMGIDQGAVQGGAIDTVHYWSVSEWSVNTIDPTGRKRHVRGAGKCNAWEDLEAVVERYQPKVIVIDNMPDQDKAIKFARKYKGKCWLAYYRSGGLKGGDICKWDRRGKKRYARCVDIDRTHAFDRMTSRFHSGPERIVIPADYPDEMESHLVAPLRIVEKDRNGNLTVKWKTPQKEHDHYAHAMVYDEVAGERMLLSKPKVTIL